MSTGRHVPVQLNEILARIAAAADSCGRRHEEVKLVAVSKTFSPELVSAAYDAGQRRFGENRVQELLTKTGSLPTDIEWHLIGHLQANKAAKAVASATWIHSVDSAELVQRLDRLAGEQQRHPKILLEVNVSCEESKFGLRENDVILKTASAAAAAKNLSWLGLMTMAPYEAPEKELRLIFSGLRKLRDSLSSNFGIPLPELSMGMSGDFEAAIKEGSTIVRVGTAIFGERTRPGV